MFEEIARLYHDLDQGMQPISVIFPNLPIAVHRTRDRSGTCLLVHGSPRLVWEYTCKTCRPSGWCREACACLALLINSVALKRAAACRARKQVAAIFKKVIENRRATGTKEDDVLQVRVHASPPAATLCLQAQQHCDSSSVAAIQPRPGCTTGPWQMQRNSTTRGWG